MSPTLRRTRKDAAGRPLAADGLYEPACPYSSDLGTFNRESQLRGDHPAVQAQPQLWLPVDLDSETKRRLQVEAQTPPAPAWSIPPPRPKSQDIPPERQVFAVESFSVGPDYVQRGQIVDIKHRLVKRYPELFRKPPQPIDPQEAA